MREHDASNLTRVPVAFIVLASSLAVVIGRRRWRMPDFPVFVVVPERIGRLLGAYSAWPGLNVDPPDLYHPNALLHTVPCYHCFELLNTHWNWTWEYPRHPRCHCRCHDRINPQHGSGTI